MRRATNKPNKQENCAPTEVTPEMAAAGGRLLENAYDAADGDDMAAKVFAAMIEARAVVDQKRSGNSRISKRGAMQSS
jgi:hypothetical protein